MGKIITESGYTFDFSDSLDAFKANCISFHDLSAVDFVVETENKVLLIEIKNPDNKKATKESREKFFNDLENDFYPYKIGAKFTNMLLRKWVAGSFYNKPIIFIFILEFKNLNPGERRRLEERISQRLPFSLNNPDFKAKEVLEDFELLSIEEFCEKYPQFSVKEKEDNL